MVMCSRCHKRMAVVFVTKMENGEKSTQGLCLKCAKEIGVPIDNLMGNVMGQLGISADNLENAEEEILSMMEQATPSDCDDTEDDDSHVHDVEDVGEFRLGHEHRYDCGYDCEDSAYKCDDRCIVCIRGHVGFLVEYLPSRPIHGQDSGSRGDLDDSPYEEHAYHHDYRSYDAHELKEVDVFGIHTYHW